MDSGLLPRLEALPRLGQAPGHAVPCKICGEQSDFFDVVDFNKCCADRNFYRYGPSGIPVTYQRCRACGFIFTIFFDDWTPDEFARFVYNDDYIKVDPEYDGRRAARQAAWLTECLHGLEGLRILEYGSGLGSLAELLRSQGLRDVTNYDPFSSPTAPAGKFDLVTCFEVLEHATAPRTTLADIARLLHPGGCVVFTTSIQPANIEELRANWWYVAPRNGHASICTRNALAVAGRSAGLTLHAGARGMAFAGPSASAETSQILEFFGPACHFLRLAAPGPDDALPEDAKSHWHGVEDRAGAPYRWTRKAEIVWRLGSEPIQPCGLTVTIPFRMAVRPGFADDCRLVIGDRIATLSQGNGELRGSFAIDEPVEPVLRLFTPPVERPCDVRSSHDDRQLGLAINTAAGVRQAPDTATFGQRA